MLLNVHVVETKYFAVVHDFSEKYILLFSTVTRMFIGFAELHTVYERFAYGVSIFGHI